MIHIINIYTFICLLYISYRDNFVENSNLLHNYKSNKNNVHYNQYKGLLTTLNKKFNENSNSNNNYLHKSKFMKIPHTTINNHISNNEKLYKPFKMNEKSINYVNLLNNNNHDLLNSNLNINRSNRVNRNQNSEMDSINSLNMRMDKTKLHHMIQYKINEKQFENKTKTRWWLDTIAKILHSHPLTLSGNSRILHNPFIDIQTEENDLGHNNNNNNNNNNLNNNNDKINDEFIKTIWNKPIINNYPSNTNNKENFIKNNPSLNVYKNHISENSQWVEYQIRERIKNYRQLMSSNQWKQFILNDPLEKTKFSKFNLALFEATVIGVKRAVAECRYQFKHERWNCSQAPDDETALFGNLLLKGIPQTAFVYSIINAGIVQSVAEACLNQIDNCPCNNRGRQKPHSDWQWQGCDHNIHYGRRFSRRLLDTMERGSHIRFEMNLHNNGVGRLLVLKNMERYCRCHGTSGSCTLKTCYRRTPRMRTLGNLLKQIYEHDSVQVQLISPPSTHQSTSINQGYSSSSDESNLKIALKSVNYHTNKAVKFTPYSKINYMNPSNLIKSKPTKTRIRPSKLRLWHPNIQTSLYSTIMGINNLNLTEPHPNQLVYYETIPQTVFCEPQPQFHIVGTRGRICNSSTFGPNNCRNLCCERGFLTHHYYTMESCNCKFIWCCRVECQQCLVLKKTETCI